MSQSDSEYFLKKEQPYGHKTYKHPLDLTKTALYFTVFITIYHEALHVKISKIIIGSLFVISLIFCNFAIARTSNSFSTSQKAAIEKIVHSYLIEHPEILVEASNALQEKELSQSRSDAINAAKANADKLFRNASDPVAGNPKGTITLIEFFDYQCVHCREMPPAIAGVIKANPNLKVVYKELPIFGKESVFAAKAALAANLQGKYSEMHHALITSPVAINKQTVLSMAKKVGLNVDQLKKDMSSPAIDKMVKDNYSLAQALKVMGTPEIIIANTDYNGSDSQKIEVIPGATSQETLQAKIDHVKQ